MFFWFFCSSKTEVMDKLFSFLYEYTHGLTILQAVLVKYTRNVKRWYKQNIIHLCCPCSVGARSVVNPHKVYIIYLSPRKTPVNQRKPRGKFFTMELKRPVLRALSSLA